MDTIAENKYYELSIDTDQNRIFVTIKGFWSNKSVVPDYLNDWRKAVKMAKPNFTVLADIRTMKIHPAEVLELHTASIEISKNAGVARSAEVVEQIIVRRQMDRVYKESHLNENKFTSIEDANAYLDMLEDLPKGGESKASKKEQPVLKSQDAFFGLF